MRAACARIETLDARTLDTPCRPIQYAVRSKGYPILFVHGNGGGFDQGLDLGATHVGEGYLGIAPSRFGYLGTPMPQKATPQLQADAFTCLLEALDIRRAAVIAWSIGGMSALQLALRHPQRVSALILVSTGISGHADTKPPIPPELAVRAAVRSDFLFWLATRPLRPITQFLFFARSLRVTEKEQTALDDAMDKALPIHPRARGILFDTQITATDPRRNSGAYPLERLNVPVLILNGRNDPLTDRTISLEMSRQMPQARLVTIKRGGHLLLGHEQRVRQEIATFLSQHAAPPGAEGLCAESLPHK